MKKSKHLVPVAIGIAVMLILAGYFLMPAGTHYRLFHDEASFNKVLS